MTLGKNNKLNQDLKYCKIKISLPIIGPSFNY